MEYIRSKKYETKEWMSKIMGPNPIKLEEELLLSWTPEQLDYMHDVPYGTWYRDVRGQPCLKCVRWNPMKKSGRTG